MTDLNFPEITTRTKLPSGPSYSYVHVPAKDSKPYILFLHGFPSSAYDWRYQIGYFSERGYGLIVPDLLGYGATDKPQEKEAYRLKKMSKEIVKILDICGVETLIGIGHDWGSFFLSRLANYYPARFSKYAFLDVAYQPPSAEGFDFHAINEETTKTIGYPVFEYWDFFKDEDSGSLMDEKTDLTMSIVYSASEEFVKDRLCRPGATREYWTSGTPGSIASWLTPDEIAMHNKIFASEQGGYGPPLNWYKCHVANLNTPDEAQVPKDDWHLRSPTLLIKCLNDLVGVPAVQEKGMRPWIKDELLEVVEIDSGHWCQLQKPQETNEILERFIVS